MTKDEIRTKLKACFDAASKATAKWEERRKADNGSIYPCGFAWIRVPDGRSTIAKLLKKEFGGFAGGSFTGVQVWDPSNFPTQAMYARVYGAMAFISEFTLQGLGDDCDITYGYRFD